MKSEIMKFKIENDSFPKNLIIANEEITNKKSKAIRQIWEPKYHIAQPILNHICQIYITTVFGENSLTEDEFKNLFFLLNANNY